MKPFILSALILGFVASGTLAQSPKALTDAERIAKLESQVQALQAQLQKDDGFIGPTQDQGALVFLYMCFAGTLATSSGRNFWLWFLLGIFTVPTVIVLVLLIGSDKKKGQLGSA
jgi:hypothetical protein